MITAQVESFENCLPELKVLFPVHHGELGLFKGQMPLAPQYGEYVERERAGNLFLVTVRVDGNIAAYYVAQVAPGFHYEQTLTGTMDIMYVAPSYRGGGLCLPLFRAAERELKRRGVKVWYSGYKHHNPLNMPMLLLRLGFRPADVYCVKWLGDENGDN